MYLELTPTSFTLADSGMFIIGTAKYKFKKSKDLPIGCVAKLLPAEVEGEYKGAKEVTICFKSPALQAHNTPIGILNLFYSKVFEPQVEEKPAEKVELETLDVSTSITVDKERVKQCEVLVEDCQQYIGQVWRYEIEDTL